MSRTLDLLLVALVLGLGWWLFGAGTASQAALGADATGPEVRLGPAVPASGTNVPAPAWTGSITLVCTVDDPALLSHPSLAFVVAEGEAGRLVRVSPSALDPIRGLTFEFAARPRALGLAIAELGLEVLAWVELAPGDPTTRASLVEQPLRLGERVQRVAFEVVDAAGAPCEDVVLQRPLALGTQAFGDGPRVHTKDSTGHILLPRRAGVTVDVVGPRGSARVVDPRDGMRVTLAPEPLPR